MIAVPSAPVDAPAPRTAVEHIAHGLALWTVEGNGCGREELAMRLYRLAGDVATGGRLWVSTVEHTRELAEAGKRRGQSL